MSAPLNSQVPTPRSIWPGCAVLVATGIALGLTHNLIGLRSHPVHGIPWVASRQELPHVEAVIPADSPSGAASRFGTTEDSTIESPRAAPPLVSSPLRASSSPRSAPAVRRDANVPPGPHPSETLPAQPAPAERPEAAVPFIPEMTQAMQVTLPTVRRLHEQKAALFMDARDLSEYEEGHIPGAVWLTRDDVVLDPDRAKALGKPERVIVTYCDGGACEASGELAEALGGVGFRRVLVYRGGFPEWVSAGHAVTRGRAP